MRDLRGVATLSLVEPPISHSDVTTLTGFIGDIREDVHRIWQLLEDEDGEAEEDDG